MSRWFYPLTAVLCLLLVSMPGASQSNRQDPTKLPVPRLLRSPTLSKTHIVFAFADDLWSVPRKGGEARRLTTDAGVENDPVFSPDGKWIAFTGQYDSNDDVYIIPAAGGEPRRLTYHPGVDAAVGWTPDSKRVLFRSSRTNYARTTQLFTIGLEGGLPEEVPLPIAHHGSYSPDGKRLAYVPMINHPARAGTHVAWNKYRGGKAPWVWLADLSDSKVTAIPRKDSNDTHPMWVEERVYFLSDRDGPTTLYVYETNSKKVRKLVDNDEDDIRTACAGADGIVYEKASGLYLFDLKDEKATRVDVSLTADLSGVRTRFVKLADQIQKAGLSPSGSRAVFEARGEVFTVPAQKGDIRNLTNTSGVAERDPAWSPDGKWIAYFSDASGEYELHLAPQDGVGKVRKLKLSDKPTYYYNPTWSPDSKKISYNDKQLNYWFIDVESGKTTKLDTNPYASFGSANTPQWSPDGQWLAYLKQLKSHYHAVFLYSLKTAKTTQLTDGMSDVGDVAFDQGGKYLYFTASTDAGPATGAMMSSLDRPVSRDVYLVVLASNMQSPFAAESDEEKGQQNPNKKTDTAKKDPVPVRIDLEDIDQRILSVPVPTRNYIGLMPGKSGVLFIAEGPEVTRRRMAVRPGAPEGITIHRFELSKRKAEKFLENVSTATVSNNGEKILYRQGKNWSLVGTQTPPKPGEGQLKLDGMQARVDPRAEWKQIYNEVWRIERDFLYDPNYHGLDIKKTQQRFSRYLDGLGSRHDLNYLLQEVLSRLCLGHVYIRGGDFPDKTITPGGLLGCDYTIENGRYRISRIFRGENWNPALRAPLTQPGSQVKEGEYLLAVDGEDLKSTDSVHRMLEGKADRTVSLRVGPKADGTGARNVKVVPVRDEQSLRHYAWVTENRKKVEKMTGGKVAYVYLPNTHAAGHERWVREFYPQVGKEAIIIDERFNGGGFLADEVVELLRRPIRNFSVTREGEDQIFPRSIFGPKVMLINEAAGSGGDYLPYTFRQAKLGPLVGKRTWGGLVGIGGYPTLLDGGSVTAPHWGLYFPNSKWDVENIGVSPDIEVEHDPALVRAGRDPQLEKAIEIVLAEMKKQPPVTPKRPVFPNYYKK